LGFGEGVFEFGEGELGDVDYGGVVDGVCGCMMW
jgi:hypothetical protein